MDSLASFFQTNTYWTLLWVALTVLTLIIAVVNLFRDGGNAGHVAHCTRATTGKWSGANIQINEAGDTQASGKSLLTMKIDDVDLTGANHYVRVFDDTFQPVAIHSTNASDGALIVQIDTPVAGMPMRLFVYKL